MKIPENIKNELQSEVDVCLNKTDQLELQYQIRLLKIKFESIFLTNNLKEPICILPKEKLHEISGILDEEDAIKIFRYFPKHL